MGDELDPDIITSALALQPSLSYRKGETYWAGRRRQREIVGRTGLWLLSTESRLESGRLEDHLELLASLLKERAERLGGLRQIVREGGYEASAICFWAGPAQAAQPSVPGWFRELVGRIGGEIEVDFYQDDAAEEQTAAE